MELHELAERVLFATTLEEKLQCPAVVSDEHPGAAITAPPSPGRPAELGFKPQGAGKSDFPGLHRLEDERERGRLLHYFANHELLATELMALVLLRFPDAPAAFRRGILQTLKDEQEHTRLYMGRMKECGVHFGELPVSGYFWRSVSGMENPMDYVTGLSLTFEQANLDFCRHFSAGFATVGDRETARLLDGIYRDEIAHVAYGLKWFRRWKNPDESDWAAYCRQLKFPLSPSRAKGTPLNIEGRRAAGLDQEFIDELNVFGQSKGRTPVVYVFNPLCEGRIAEGRKFNPVKYQAALVRDLSNLPQYLCRQDDIVLVERRPSPDFLAGIKAAGFPLPEFSELKNGVIDLKSGLAGRKINSLRPWAWGPDALELFEPIWPHVGGEKNAPADRFNPAIAGLYSKTWSAAFLRKFLESLDDRPDWLCGVGEVGVAAASLEEALWIVEDVRAHGHHKVIVKAAHGLAGRNAIRLWEPEVKDHQRRWIERAVVGGRQVVVEPWLERSTDFSVQLEIDPRGMKLVGFTGLENDVRGQYLANWAAPNYERRIPARVAGLFAGVAGAPARLPGLFGELVTALEVEVKTVGYHGPMGIDCMVYRSATGEVRLKPVVEINPRYTMGRLTLELMKRTCPGSWGAFWIVNLPTVQREGFDGFQAFVDSLRQQFPIQMKGSPTPRIWQGAVALNDPGTAASCLAVFQTARGFEPLVSVSRGH